MQEVASTSPEVIRRLQAISEERNHARSAALLVGVVIAVALFQSGRHRAPMIAPPAMAGEAPAPSTSTAGPVVVHVAGAVRRPGVYELPGGARVRDALERAGGALPKAELTSLNLAELVRDGQQILVPTHGEARSIPVGGVTAAALIDLNDADQATLENIPGIGPVKAAAILAYRTEIGAFATIEQLLEVTGIGAATLESIRPYVTL